MCAGKKIADYWESSKKLLNDANKFLDSLLTFDRDNIPDAVIKKIEPYMAMEEFTPEAVAKVSKACTSICMWVRAMHLYHTVSLSVSASACLPAVVGRQLCLRHVWPCQRTAWLCTLPYEQQTALVRQPLQENPANGLRWRARKLTMHVLKATVMHLVLPLALSVAACRLLPSAQPWRLHRSPLTRPWVSSPVRKRGWLQYRRRLQPLKPSTRKPQQRRPPWRLRSVLL